MGSKRAPKNKYVKDSHLSERKFRELPRLFRADATALSAASSALLPLFQAIGSGRTAPC